MPLDRDDIVKILKDAPYVAVGLGVVTAEHLDKLRADLVERWSTQATNIATAARNASADARKMAADGRRQLRGFVLRSAA